MTLRMEPSVIYGDAYPEHPPQRESEMRPAAAHPLQWESEMRPAAAQRARMIERFHKRKMASDPRSLEHRICSCVVLALLYGGSVRTINRMSKVSRELWSRSL